jgi:transposase
VFLDETGLMLQPVVRRSWGPKGCPSVMYCWDRRDRLSVIGALSRAPRKRRIGLYFVMYDRNVTAEEVVAFLRHVQRSLGRKVIVVMDRWAAHRKAARLLYGDKRFWIEWLPPYAPDLNPVDKLWGHTKHDDLANFIPDDLPDLEGALDYSFDRTHECPRLLRSFFHAAELEL